VTPQEALIIAQMAARLRQLRVTDHASERGVTRNAKVRDIEQAITSNST